MKRIILFISLILFTASALAQEASQPKASDTPVVAKSAKEAPAEVTLPADVVKTLLDKAKDVRIAQLEANTLQLQIEKAQQQLKELTEKAEKLADESKAAYQRAAIKAGIPVADLEQYEGQQQPDGSLKLRRKQQAPPKP